MQWPLWLRSLRGTRILCRRVWRGSGASSQLLIFEGFWKKELDKLRDPRSRSPRAATCGRIFRKLSLRGGQNRTCRDAEDQQVCGGGPTVTVTEEDTTCTLIFWVAPLRWLGTGSGPRTGLCCQALGKPRKCRRSPLSGWRVPAPRGAPGRSMSPCHPSRESASKDTSSNVRRATAHPRPYLAGTVTHPHLLPSGRRRWADRLNSDNPASGTFTRATPTLIGGAHHPCIFATSPWTRRRLGGKARTSVRLSRERRPPRGREPVMPFAPAVYLEARRRDLTRGVIPLPPCRRRAA